MRVALTGASTGIGAEIVVRMAEAGHQVVAFDIAEPTGRVDYWIKTDLGNPASIAAALEAAQGPFDALINNAGVPPKPQLEELVLQVNWFGLVAFLDGMLPKLAKGASIVSTASRAGAFWRDNLDQVKALMALDPEDLMAFVSQHNMDATRAYNLSKEAVIVMTMARTEEMIGRDLRMNCVSPAAVSTSILDDFVKAFGPRVAKNIERAGRPGTPREIADVICWLASPDSYWVKGQDISIDGGISAMVQSDMLGLPARP
jgi:NAD(P)-dependent dehydrogenase (short-subunit alcohol dehydrogenase family)